MKKISIITLLVLIAFVSTAECAVIDFSFRFGKSEKIKHANALVDSGDYEGGIAIYREILAAEPESDIVNYNMGAALYAAGNYKEALEFFSKATSTEIEELEMNSFFAIGNIYYRMSERTEAADIDVSIALCEKALQYYTFVAENYEAGWQFKYNCEAAQERINALGRKRRIGEALSRSGGDSGEGAIPQDDSESGKNKKKSQAGAGEKQSQQSKGGQRQQPSEESQQSSEESQQQEKGQSSTQQPSQTSTRQSKSQNKPDKGQSQAQKKAEDLKQELKNEEDRSKDSLAKKEQALDEAKKRRDLSQKSPEDLKKELERDAAKKESDLDAARKEAKARQDKLTEELNKASEEAQKESREGSSQNKPDKMAFEGSEYQTPEVPDQPRPGDKPEVRDLPTKLSDMFGGSGTGAESEITPETAKVILSDYEERGKPLALSNLNRASHSADKAVAKDW